MIRYLLILLSGAALGQPVAPVCPFVWDAVSAKNANGSTTAWTGMCSSDPRDGGGGFLQFLTPNKAGTFVSGITLNGGLVSAATGNEQGDMDVGVYVDGKQQVISFTGRYQGNEPGILMWPPDLFWLGSATNRWAGIAMTQHPCPKSVPGKPAYCYATPDGFIPVYK